MKEIRLVVMAKRVVVYSDESKLLAQVGIFGLSQFQFHDSRNTENDS